MTWIDVLDQSGDGTQGNCVGTDWLVWPNDIVFVTGP